MTRTLRSTLSAATLVAGGFFTAGAFAAGPDGAPPGSGARMQAERATCDGVQQDRAACLREAGAARQEAGRAGLTTPSAAREDNNALARCREQPAADRADCEARIRGGARTSTEGSVMGGGVVRETVTPLPPRTIPAPQ